MKFGRLENIAKKAQEQYGNSSISMLKGEERVRKRPAVIFESDDLEGCKHAVFEILSNAIDEAREGHGDTIIVTRYEDLSVEVYGFRIRTLILGAAAVTVLLLPDIRKRMANC